jgi:hypothetical protein
MGCCSSIPGKIVPVHATDNAAEGSRKRSCDAPSAAAMQNRSHSTAADPQNIWRQSLKTTAPGQSPFEQPAGVPELEYAGLDEDFDLVDHQVAAHADAASDDPLKPAAEQFCSSDNLYAHGGDTAADRAEALPRRDSFTAEQSAVSLSWLKAQLRVADAIAAEHSLPHVTMGDLVKHHMMPAMGQQQARCARRWPP